jgi:hypothetical protein
MNFSKRAVAKVDGGFTQYTGLAARDRIRDSHQLPEEACANLDLDKKSRPEERNCKNNGTDDTIWWDGGFMAFRDEEGAITCNLIDGKSGITERELSTRSIKILIGDHMLRSEICAYLGIGKKENAKGERLEGEAIKITPGSGLHKAEEF